MRERDIDRAFERLRDDAGDVDVMAALDDHGRRRRRSARIRTTAAIGAAAAALGVVFGVATLVGGADEPEEVRTIDDRTVPPTSTTTTVPENAPTVPAADSTVPDGASTVPDVQPEIIDEARLADVSRVVAAHGTSGPQLAVEPHAGPPGTAGSGCAVPDDTPLPDGVFFVEVVADEGGEVLVDVLCFSTVDSARAAGVDSLFEDWEVVRPDGPTRSVPAADGARWVLQTVPVRSPGQTSVAVLLSSTVDALAFAADGTDQGVPAPLRGWALIERGALVELFQPPLASA